MNMRWAIPASLGIHLGLLAGAWIAMQWKPEDLSTSEAAVSIDIVSMEDAVTEPTQTLSEATANLVSAGMTSVASEPVETEIVEAADPVEPVQVAEAEPIKTETAEPVETQAAAVPVTETIQPAETEDLVSAEVMTALAEAETPIAAPVPQVTDDAATVVAETVAPSDAEILERLDRTAKLAELEPAPKVQEITTASINPITAAEPVDSIEPVKVANLTPVLEPVVEEVVAAPPPIPKPRIVRKPVEAEEKPVEKKKAADKPIEKPVEKKQPKQVASLGNGGEAEADSAASNASGGTVGKVTTAGKGTIDAWQGKVRARLLKAVRKPKGSDGGEARVMFTLDANGRVLSARLSKTSGDDKLDAAAFAAVERGAPYPPIPEGAGKSTWSFTVPIAIN